MPRVCSNTCRGAERRRYYRGSNRRSVFEYTLRIRYNASDEMKPLSLSLFICLDKLRSHRPSPASSPSFRNRPRIATPPRRRTPLIIHQATKRYVRDLGCDIRAVRMQ